MDWCAKSVIRHSVLKPVPIWRFCCELRHWPCQYKWPSWRCLANYWNENVLFNPVILKTSRCYKIFKRFVQSECQFVVPASKLDYCADNTRYSLAKVTNFADHSWTEAGWIMESNQVVEQTLHQWILTIQRIQWKEACDIVSFFRTAKESQSMRQVCNFAKSLFLSLSSVIYKRERTGFNLV